MTKEDIFSSKDIYTILAERKISSSELDDLVTDWLTEAEGFVKGAIMESYHQYISDDTWRYIYKTFCKYQSLLSVYSTGEQDLVQNHYIQLVDYVNRLNENVKMQASLNAIPNKSNKIRIFNAE